MLDLGAAIAETRKALKDTLLRHTRKSNLHLSVPAFQADIKMAAFSTGVTTTAPTTPPPAVDLPWKPVWSDMGYFFWNTHTEETSWKHTREMEAARDERHLTGMSTRTCAHMEEQPEEKQSRKAAAV